MNTDIEALTKSPERSLDLFDFGLMIKPEQSVDLFAMPMQPSLKAKLCAALAAAGCVLVVDPANAISVTINPGATFTSVPGAVLFDDFDLVENTAIGTITGGVLNVGSTPATDIFTGNFIATGNDFDVITVMLTNPASYVGFIWGTPDRNNEVDVYNGSTLLGSFFGEQNGPGGWSGPG